MHPCADGLHRHLISREDATLDQQCPDASIVAAGLCRIGETHDGPICKPHTA